MTSSLVSEVNKGLSPTECSGRDTVEGCTVYDVAPVPISCLIDTGKYYESIVQNPENPVPSAALNIGLAEYSNANFFSEDRLFDSYPFPRADQVELGPLEEWPTAGPNDPPEDKWRRYLIKNGPGEVVAHLAVPTALWEFLPEQSDLRMRKLKLDDRVFEDYGELLLPPSDRLFGRPDRLLLPRKDRPHPGSGQRGLVHRQEPRR
jgi:hypothetical protein